MIELIVLLLSLLLMALFAAVETAFVSADKVALVIDLPPGVESRSVFYFLRNNEVFFATVVVASNVFVTAFSSIAEFYFHTSLGIQLPIVIGATTVVGFLTGELVPKSIAIENPEPTARLLLPFVKAFAYLTKPIVAATAAGSGFLARVVFNSPSSNSLMFQRRDVYRFLGTTVKGGYLDKIESDLIRRLLENASVPVKNIAVPRTEIVSVKSGTRIEKLREAFEKTGKSKIIVYDSTIDNVIGVVYAKDIFKDVQITDELVSDVLFVPEQISVVDLLDEFRNEKVYVAILIDEFGGTSGLVTSSDVMELFLGEVAIWDSEVRVKAIAPKQFVLQGNAEVHEIEEAAGVTFPSGEYSTVAGLIISQIGRIPSRGEVIRIGNLEFQVVRADGRKINTLKLILK